MDSCVALLKESQLKVTPKRRAVIALFLKTNRHMSPAEVFDSLRRKISPLGFPTVYRILEELVGAGVLIQTPFHERQLSYALCRHPGAHHHHFICTTCRKVEEVEYCNLDRLSRVIAKKLGARVTHHLLHIEGECRHCGDKRRKR